MTSFAAPSAKISGTNTTHPKNDTCPANPSFQRTKNDEPSSGLWISEKHPRLIVNEAEIMRARNLLSTDLTMQQWYNIVNSKAEKMLTKPFPPINESTYRIMMRQMITLAGLFLLDRDPRKLTRAKADLLHLSDQIRWDVPNELALGEISFAAGVGFDWLYNELSASEKNRVRDALIKKSATFPTACKTLGGNNWMQVCYGGVGIATLAAANQDELSNPQSRTRRILEEIKDVLPRTSLQRYEPDGAWYEGLTYWNYALTYTTHFISALKTSLGTDLGILKDVPSFSRTGEFYSYTIGSSGRVWNFGDAWDRQPAVRLMWHAREYRRADYMNEATKWHGKEFEQDAWPAIFFLLEYDPRCGNSENISMQRVKQFGGINPVIFFRSGDADPKAFWMGIKGGTNTGSHVHFDMGSFVMEFKGQRFAEDLGPDRYDIPGYFGERRNSIYRIKTEGHNTLTISRNPIRMFDAPNQRKNASAGFRHVAYDQDSGVAVVDLTDAYSDQAISKAWRGLYHFGNTEILIHDVLESNSPVYVNWNMHTISQVDILGSRAVLTKNGVSIYAEILEPNGLVFNKISPNPKLNDPNSPEDPNIGVERLTIALPRFSGAKELKVRFRLVDSF